MKDINITKTVGHINIKVTHDTNIHQTILRNAIEEIAMLSTISPQVVVITTMNTIEGEVRMRLAMRTISGRVPMHT